MKTVASLLLATSAVANEVNPIEKVVQMMSDLQAKIIKEGEASQKTYEEFAEWCEDRSKELGFEIKTGTSEAGDLQATIEKETANAESLETKIDELSGSIATDEADLKAATEIREKEAAAFAAEEKELNSVIDMLQRAIAVLEKELGGASLMQVKSAKNLEQALEVMVKASAITSMDAKGITALVQEGNGSEDSDDDSGAPDAAVYESHSGGIIDTLNGLLEKAENQLNTATGTETANKNNFEQLKQSLTDEIKFANKDMDEAKKGLAESGEIKAAAEGDLEVTNKALAEDRKALGELHMDCMTKAQDFEAETTSRGEELKALAMAKKAVVENTSGAASQTYDFLQTMISSSSDLRKVEAMTLIKNLAKQTKTPALAQLAARINSVIRLNHGADVFAKIKGMIEDMIEKIEQEMAEAAELKEWCDKEYAETNAKKDDATAEFEKLTTKLDSATAQSKKLKEEVATLQKELAALAKTQSEMDRIRSEEKAAYEQNKPELEAGLKGVKLALKILNDYYAKAGKAHSSSDGAGSGIIGMLEVIESDFTKGLTEMVAAEEMAADTYEKETKENAIEKTTKEQDVKYKTQEFTGLDKKIAQLTTDKDGVSEELDALNEYLKGLDKKCIYKVESYAERKARREAEIQGLKEALDTLENETAFIQKSSRHALRGVKKHA
jgi:chromosome segregation ATPase